MLRRKISSNSVNRVIFSCKINVFYNSIRFDFDFPIRCDFDLLPIPADSMQFRFDFDFPIRCDISLHVRACRTHMCAGRTHTCWPNAHVHMQKCNAYPLTPSAGACWMTTGGEHPHPVCYEFCEHRVSFDTRHRPHVYAPHRPHAASI